VTFVRETAGAISFDVTRANNSGLALILGAICAQPSGAADEVTACNVTADNEASRPVGVVTEAGGIADASSGTIMGTAGQSAEVAMVAGLTPSTGEEVIVSTTNALGTIPGSGVGEPSATGTVLQRVGIINDISAYAGSQRVKVQIDFGQRRVN
jgi:hypothetical protein